MVESWAYYLAVTMERLKGKMRVAWWVDMMELKLDTMMAERMD